MHLLAAEMLEPFLGAVGRDNADVENIIARKDPDVAVGVAGVDVEIKIVGIWEVDIAGAKLVLEAWQQP